jgi:SSS family solute:Na+ symporter
MTAEIDWAALAVFLVLLGLVTALGFGAARWRRPKTLAHLEEWGLGGRQFGTWITWFLIGGDIYTAYTMIAVPALVYATGAFGFFAIPYAILVYPFVFAVMPILWHVAKKNNHVTAADVVYGRYRYRPLELAVAITGVIATMPYIALQLIGIETVFHALGIKGELPLVAAFLILALNTYSAGLRAPALIAIVKDTLIYIVVLAAISLVPYKLGGYGAVFEAAGAAFKAQGSGGLLLSALCEPRTRLSVCPFHVSARNDRDFGERQRQYDPQERNAAPGLFGGARAYRAHGFDGPCGGPEAFEQQ